VCSSDLILSSGQIGFKFYLKLLLKTFYNYY
jgi:hypothetical protein